MIKNFSIFSTLIRNAFMETQRRNALVNELNRIENELGRGALPYHDRTILKSRRDELIEEIKKRIIITPYKINIYLNMYRDYETCMFSRLEETPIIR